MITIDLVPILKWILEENPSATKICTLGRQTIGFDSEGLEKLIAYGQLPKSARKNFQADQETILGHLGFETIDSLDVSDYEGCTHLFDLNEPKLPSKLANKYDVVLTGGTLEHIFEVGNAIRNTLGLLKKGGLLIHIGPLNNWIDHGFYQFSPTLWYDLASENGMSVLQSAACDFITTEDGLGYHVYQVAHEEGRHILQNGLKCSHIFVARRDKKQPFKVPKQNMYLRKHDAQDRRFEIPSMLPFKVVDGKKTFDPRSEITIDTNKIQKIETDVWGFKMKQDVAVGGSKNRPFRSSIIVMEDGVPLPYRAADLAAISAAPPGRFAHQGNQILFSTSDATEPSENGRQYSISIPID